METRTIKISLETAQRWYNGTDNELKELAVQTYPEIAKKELPKSWEDLKTIKGYFVERWSKVEDVESTSCKETEKNIFATKEQAEASIAMAQLSQLMKVYNDGWEPDWTYLDEEKFCIEFYKNKIWTDVYTTTSQFLSFQDKETRDLFLENFRYLIEQAKPLMS
jgi:hypothetical protein